MRCAVHVDALEEIFIGEANYYTGSVVLASKIGITTSILSDYNAKLGKNPAFQAWIANANTSNRLPIFSVTNAPSSIKNLPSLPHQEYGAASYFSGGHIFTTLSTSHSPEFKELEDLGIIQLPISLPINGDLPGDNPIASITLNKDGNINFDVLKNYFISEDEIVIYDKYINQSGMDFILYIVRNLKDGSSLKIFTTTINSKCLKPTIIERQIKSTNPRIVAQCNEVSTKFRQETHDRYIFCGSRLQIIFTAGLDSFGPRTTTGTRKNKMSNIFIYALNNTNQLEIEHQNGICRVCCIN